MLTRLRLLLALAAALLAAGCQSIGPGSMQRDRLDYGEAIASSWKEQTLLNIVKLRYLDAPAFLEVASIIGSYTLQSDVSLTSRIFPFSRTDTYHQLGATGTYIDRPTVSYTPVTGQKYINNVLRPIAPQSVFAVIQGGRAADYILRLTTQAINGVSNYAPGRGRPQREGATVSKGQGATFVKVIQALRNLQQAGALQIRIEKRGDREVTLISFLEDAGSPVNEDIDFVRDTLDISPDSKELMVNFGATRGGPNEITVLTRSMMQILGELSTGVDVPPHDLAEGRAAKSAPTGDTPLLLHIYSGRERSPDAWVAARYRDHWFWVDDRDLESKRVFAFLTIFSSIAETGTMPQIPVLTIPAN